MLKTRPEIAHIETTTRCVGLCEFCPHATNVAGRPDMMSMETYELVLKRIVDAGGFQTVHLFGNGDPFCDDRLPELIKMIPRDYRIVLYTTLGMVLTDEAIKASRRCAVVLSAATLSPTARKHRNENLTRISIDAVHAVGTERAMALGMALADGAQTQVKVFSLSNWLGKIKTLTPVMQETCGRVEHELYVLTTGQVALCCMDGAGAFLLGDLNVSSVDDIYKSPLVQRYLDKELGLPGCGLCTAGGRLKELLNDY